MSARTLPVTPAERACATVLRAYLDHCAFDPGEPRTDSKLVGALDSIGEVFERAGLIDEWQPEPTPAGRDLLARVEAEAPPDPTAAIVAFIRAEERRYRRNSWDSTHDAAGRERCANKASVLATMGAYIARGDHLAPPIAAPPAKEPR